MKITIFYSWQSDSPNNKNRSLIYDSIKKAANQLLKDCSKITELEIEMDSRNESGTPDLVNSIFTKIDNCDIFIADISIINHNSKERLVPNPNVLLELGYAAKTIGWSNIICIYNLEYSAIESLPFDIQHRKPLTYNTCTNISEARKMVEKMLQSSIESIINTRIVDKREYVTTKFSVDIRIQSILIDFCRMLYETDQSCSERFNYPKLLHSSPEDVEQCLRNKEILGFHIFKNVSLNIDELISFFNNELDTYFLSEQEKRILAKMVFSLRRYKELLYTDSVFYNKGESTDYSVLSGNKMNSQNSIDSYLLIRPLDDGKAVVISGGDFAPETVTKLLSRLTVHDEYIFSFCRYIHDILLIINDWIKATGNYFIMNHKMLHNNPTV